MGSYSCTLLHMLTKALTGKNSVKIHQKMDTKYGFTKQREEEDKKATTNNVYEF